MSLVARYKGKFSDPIHSFKRQSAHPAIYPSQRHLYCRCLVYYTCLKIPKGVVVFRRCISKDRHYNS